MPQLQILTPTYYTRYRQKQRFTLRKHFNRLKQIPVSLESFRFYIASSAIFSSQIEGVDVDFNSFLRYQNTKGVLGGKDVKQVQDLVAAYEYARTHALNLSNVLHTHALASRQLAAKQYRGQYRDQMVSVYNLQTGQRVYEAAPVAVVESEVNKLFTDIQVLRKRTLTIDETFYYAALIHLVFAKIHPFGDGNGRLARLLEKWFLADKLGANAWFIQSERNYQRKRVSYYRDIDIGPSYAENNYDYCVDFLLMLPWALKLKMQ